MTKQKLELTWIGKEQRPRLEPRILIEDPEKSYHAHHRVSEDDSFDNRLIFGDNLLALKALLPRYAGQVKCIYIDPPYNTGDESWIYNDNVSGPEISVWIGEVVGREAEDLSRHDKPLCMMWPRLLLLYELLAEDGSFWMTLDDNEYHRG